ncbi:MAG: magnesium/cobalt transporter CorA [Acidobacteriota bacterium]
MVDIYVHRNGRTTRETTLDPAWLRPDAGAVTWVDFVDATGDEFGLLADPFRFHALSIEDATAESHHPKIETYDGYLYAILHGIDSTAEELATHDVDFFLGPNYLVTVRDGRSRSFPEVAGICLRNERVLAEGPAALMHRLLDTMVDHYGPEVDRIEERLDALEDAILESVDSRETTRQILALKREVTALRRVILPQRDVMGRLARREFVQVSDEVAYRFRDVHDHVVRVADEALLFQDRITAMFEAYLSNVSNRLNEVMKFLTILSTVFLPLTVLTGVYGMNVVLPHLPGGDGAQFWWVLALMGLLSAGMLGIFRRNRWL